jgi:methylated-DNA-protein-cysteine methyltransferase-like protein
MNFYEKMSIVCRKIPEGKVATYGQIALLCGKPKNSRQVGYGLRENLAGDDIPAYRIVNSKGELSGAAYFEYPDMQKLLLQDEGVEVFRDGNTWKVNLKKYKWEHTKEDILI